MSIPKHSQRLLILMVLVAMLATGCGFGEADAPAESPETMALLSSGDADRERGSGEESRREVAMVEAEEAPTHLGAGKAAPDAEPVEAYAADDAVTTVEATLLPAPTASTDADFSDDDSTVERNSEAETDSTVAPQQAPPLRAGEVDDNGRWDDYLLYRRSYGGPRIHERDISERYVIEVMDEQGFPVLGAQVSVAVPGQRQQEIFSALTMADGRVLFHPQALDVDLEQVERFQVSVVKDEATQQFTLTRLANQPAASFTDQWTVGLNLQQQPVEALNLDVLFLIDATGSMADEIAKIQSTIFEVSAQIDALPTHPQVRYGMVTYRDRGDSFVTRAYEFTPDVRDFSRSLDMVRAGGGGDYPESLNEGLHESLHQVEWRSEDTVKLIFLIADAPPHLDYAQDYDYAVEMHTAARRGIKIFPIASSGLDDQGEYIFRQIAQYTQGRFIFLTYDGPTNGGAPGETTTHHVEDYSVENLDRLLVRLVEDELAHQNRQLARSAGD